MLHIGLLDL